MGTAPTKPRCAATSTRCRSRSGRYDRGVRLRARPGRADVAPVALHSRETVPMHRPRCRRDTPRPRRQATVYALRLRALGIQRRAVGRNAAWMERGPAGPAASFGVQSLLARTLRLTEDQLRYQDLIWKIIVYQTLVDVLHVLDRPAPISYTTASGFPASPVIRFFHPNIPHRHVLRSLRLFHAFSRSHGSDNSLSCQNEGFRYRPLRAPVQACHCARRARTCAGGSEVGRSPRRRLQRWA
jgi:hypothetical protein